MRIAVVGAGFTGMSAAWELIKKGHAVEIFEKETEPGGLAIGFSQPGWDWTLEKHYHHIFESDTHIQRLADEIGHPYHFYSPQTFTLVEKNKDLQYWQLDSPLSLLRFGKLPLLDRVRMGIVLGYLKYLADWKSLEKETAVAWLRKWAGETNFTVLWQPLFQSKFGDFAKDVNMAWFWARIKSRSKKLGYFDGGFLALARAFLKALGKKGVVLHMGQAIESLDKLTTEFDRIIIAGAPKHTVQKVNYLGTINVILQLSEKFLPKEIYWLNMNIPNSPILAIVEHTNMVSASHYGNQHLVYVAKYLTHEHAFFSLSDEEILKQYEPILNRLKPAWKKSLINFTVHRAKFTQPVMPVNYSQHVPGFETDNPKILSASMQQVYPWDRGTNFAVELGKKVANIV